jgi:uncharacterized membrane protein
MGKTRLEAFSDGVIAILITVMVLELKIPHGPDLAALEPFAPLLAVYVVSFVFIGIYWNNHHHLLHLATRITGRILWANLHLLFWLSLIPVVTGWVGENLGAPVPTAAYGIVLLLSGAGFLVLARSIVAAQGPGSALAAALGRDLKGKLSLVLYAAGIGLAFVRPWIADVLYVTVALIWLVPDPRIEAHVDHEHPAA